MNPTCPTCRRQEDKLIAGWLQAREAGLQTPVPCPRCRAALRRLQPLCHLLERRGGEILAEPEDPREHTAAMPPAADAVATTPAAAAPWLETADGRVRGGVAGGRAMARAAAALALLLGAAMLLSSRVTPIGHPLDGPLRGAAPARLEAAASWDPEASSLTVVVRATPTDARYRLRVWSGRGELLADLESSRPLLRLPLPPPRSSALQWQVVQLRAGVAVADTGLRRFGPFLHRRRR